MNEQTGKPSEFASSEDVASTDSRLEWETPDLLVESIPQVTKGGPYHAAHPVTDDLYYS